MKHLKMIITAFSIVLIAASCKKQSVDPAPTPVATGKKLQSIATTGPAGATNQSFTYDIQGKLIKEEDDDGYKTFEYNPNTVLIKDFNKLTNKLDVVVNGTTDNAGRLINFTSITFGSNNSQIPSTGQCTYDANGYLTQYKRISNNSVYTYDFTVTDGDYTQLTAHQNGMGGYTTLTDFYTDKKALSVIERNIPESFCYNNGLFGKPNTHLAKSVQEIPTGALFPLWKNNMAYTLDNDGYVQTILTTGNGALFTTYTFQ